MEPLTIQLLGHPVVTVGRQPISFPTRKVLALLVYLVVEGGQPNRETLMALLWPESEPEKAALSLRGALSRLRKLLQPAGDYILTSGATVAFDFTQPYQLDLAWLADAAGSDLLAAELSPILDLDRGEFLEGFALPDAPGFDNWASIQRELCQRQMEIVYDRLSQHLLANHDYAQAVAVATRWVVRAPLSEQAYRRLMAAQALSGQRPAAMKTYARLQATLQEELSLAPGRETKALADHIGRGRLGEEQPVRPAATGPAPALATGRQL